MKCIIAGSRGINDYGLLDCLFTIHVWSDKITEIVSGTAKGVDQMGEQLAGYRNLKVTKMPADWSRYGKSAGYLRNEDMARYTDIAIILWDGKSRGTKHMIDLMEKYDKPCEVHVIRDGQLEQRGHFEGSIFDR